jgi:hypothetical protein
MQKVIAIQLKLFKLVQKLINLTNQKRRANAFLKKNKKQRLALYNKHQKSVNNILKENELSNFNYLNDCSQTVGMWASITSFNKQIIMVGVTKPTGQTKSGVLHITKLTPSSSPVILVHVPLTNNQGVPRATSLYGINITKVANKYVLHLTGQYAGPYSGNSGFIFSKPFNTLNDLYSDTFFTTSKNFKLNIYYPTVSEYSSCDNNVKMIHNNNALGETTAVFTDGLSPTIISWFYNLNNNNYVEINFTQYNTTFLGNNSQLYNISAQSMVYNKHNNSYTIVGSATDYTTPEKIIVAFVVDAFFITKFPFIKYTNLTTYSYNNSNTFNTTFNGLSLTNNPNSYDFAATAISAGKQVGFIGKLIRSSAGKFTVNNIIKLLGTKNFSPTSATGIIDRYIIGSGVSQDGSETVFNAGF